MPLKLVQPAKMAESQKAPPKRRTNAETRPREYLTLDEYRTVRDAARKTGRYPLRDSLLIATLFRHGLRVSEVIRLEWPMIHFGRACTLHVERVKNGTPSTHTLTGEEVRQLKQLQRAQDPPSRFVFASERGGPLSKRTAHEIVQRAGQTAGLPFPIHPHMLRHAKGYHLANRGENTRSIQVFMGHRRIESTTVYTELDPSTIRTFSED